MNPGGWHRCERWFRRGYPCPFRQLGVPREDDDGDDDELDRVADAGNKLPIPLAGDKLKKQTDAVSTKIINIEDYINEQPPVEVPVPERVAATRPVAPPGTGPTPVYAPQSGRGGRPGAGVPPLEEAWGGRGARAMASGITSRISAPYDALGVGAAHSLWTAPKSVPVPMSAKVIHVPRFGQAPIPLYENELARATQVARKGGTAPMPAPALGVRATPRGVRGGTTAKPFFIEKETLGTRPNPKTAYSPKPTPQSGNDWAVAAVIGSAMAAIGIYALGRGGTGAARAIEQAITQRIPDNRSSRMARGGKGSVRPGSGQVFDFWDMLNGIGFQ